ncbi:MAG: hypothetical protein JWM34_4173 [Ilumatobacteraceae bacterium]|nr:hypothetical protein [Ilumatobacteraceae bacterium]
MGRKQRPPIERDGAGYRFNLDREERELVHRLMGEMRALLQEEGAGEDDDDGRLKRIFPAAYHQESDKAFDVEYRRLMRDEILTSRLKGLDAVDEFMFAASGDRASATEAQMMAFLQALNGIRLVLGTMLDVDEEHDIGDVREDHPLAGEYNLYDFLSWILDWSVRAVQGG